MNSSDTIAEALLDLFQDSDAASLEEGPEGNATADSTQRRLRSHSHVEPTDKYGDM